MMPTRASSSRATGASSDPPSVAPLAAEGFTDVLTATREQLELRDQSAVNHWFQANRPDYVFLVAGTVGGILANSTRPAEFIYDNMLIHATVVQAAHLYETKKLLYLGSSCIYPRDCPQPIKEEYLLTGRLEPTNESYAIAKIAGIKLCQAYRRQYGCNFISAMPTNLYGPNDNFDLESSHVLPALIRKFHDAKIERRTEVSVWGSGKPKREFLHVDDLASRVPLPHGALQRGRAHQRGHGRGPQHREPRRADTRHRPPRGQDRLRRVQARRLPAEAPRRDAASTPSAGTTRSSFARESRARMPGSSRTTPDQPQDRSRTMPSWPDRMRKTRPDHRDHRGKTALTWPSSCSSKGYEVWGILRRSSSFNTGRIDHIYQPPQERERRLNLVYGDLNDASSLNRTLKVVRPHEIYNLGAQSHVKVSFEIPEYTAEVTGLGTVRLLEGLREVGPGRGGALLPGVVVGALRPGARGPATREHALLPAQPVRRGEGVCFLHHTQLPRGLRDLRGQRDPLQPRVAAPRRDLRHAQDHSRREPDLARNAGPSLPRQPRRKTGLGLRGRLRRGHVAHAPGRGPRRLRDRDGRGSHGARVLRSRIPAPRVAARVDGQGTERERHRRRRTSARRDRSELLPPERGRLAPRAMPPRPRPNWDGNLASRSRSWFT